MDRRGFKSLPSMFIVKHWAQVGRLMAYGFDFPLMFGRAAHYVAKILKERCDLCTMDVREGIRHHDQAAIRRAGLCATAAALPSTAGELRVLRATLRCCTLPRAPMVSGIAKLKTASGPFRESFGSAGGLLYVAADAKMQSLGGALSLQPLASQPLK
jgi:hypothetical protein